MPLHILDDKLWFPRVENALEDGLLAIGGDLSPERLMLAYRQGIFPWYDGDIPLWWCPDPRFVLYPSKLRISHSMKQLMRQQKFRFTINTAFEQVIRQCMLIERPGQDGTWINEEVVKAYTTLHYQGFAHSAEVWQDDLLAGGLYGVRLNNLFLAKACLACKAMPANMHLYLTYNAYCSDGVILIDCQVYTQHLESLGAEMIPRSQFIQVLKAQVTA